MTTNRTDSITRRGFLELTSAALVSPSLLTNTNAAEREPGLENAPVPDASASVSWLALEEHFAVETSNGFRSPPLFGRLSVKRYD